MTVSVPVMSLSNSFVLPSNAYDGDAGLDLHSCQKLTLKPFERAAVSCGLALAIPEGYAGLIVPRSGLAVRHGGYRGEIKVILVNLDPHDSFDIHIGDRIAQLVIVQVPSVSLPIVERLPESSRGNGGFGSSGV